MKKILLVLACLCFSTAALAAYKVNIINTSNDYQMEIEFKHCYGSPGKVYCDPNSEKRIVTSAKEGGESHVHTDIINGIDDNHLIQVISVAEKTKTGKLIGLVTPDRFLKDCYADSDDNYLVLDDMNESPYIRCNGHVLKTAESN